MEENVNLNQEENPVTENRIEKNVESTGFKVPLWIITIAMIASALGEFHTGSNIGKYPIIGAIVVAFYEISIAYELLSGTLLGKKYSGTFKFNLCAISIMGIFSVVDSIGLSDGNLIKTLVELIAIAGLPCWIISQLLVATKMIGTNAKSLGFTIIISICFAVGTAVVLADTPFKKSTQGLYLTIFGIVILVDLVKYALYNKYFSDKSNINK